MLPIACKYKGRGVLPGDPTHGGGGGETEDGTIYKVIHMYIYYIIYNI